MLSNRTIRFFRLYVKPFVDILASVFGFSAAVVLGFVFVFGLIGLIIAVDSFVLINLWPVVITKLFPNAVAQGFIAGTVEFSTMFWFLTALMVLRPVNIANLFSKTNKREKKDDDK